jgi:hypothetical protein
MDENGFRKFLEDRYQGSTPRTYFERAKGFEEWLFKSNKKNIDDADEGEIRAWASYIQKEVPKCRPYLYGVRAYFRYRHKDRIESLLTKIAGKLPSLPKTLGDLTHWADFDKIMRKVEETRISSEDRALLNLLWSEMKTQDILNLYVSDVDFENRLITTRKKKIQVTEKTWDALERYIKIDKRGKSEPLFSIELRALEGMTKRYLGMYGLTPSRLQRSCKEDLYDAGRTIRFAPEPDREPSSRPKQEQIKESVVAKDLFDRLIQEIKNFGNRVHDRISQIKNEGDLKRLLEGYLLARFPDEIIIPEFPFKYLEKTDLKIDFVIGKDQQTPIEVKLATEKKRIRSYEREGLSQVNEFLGYSESTKGILVIGDKKRDPERLKLRRIEGSVHIVII